ncbi:RNA pyrophosphohydrolase [Helicobacter burdigaliensis]|uniref:RNA pyrophosphohydrolase n=1 Tax=Helicobacter burdigaliensis TaxID=2315334 RepID=UPI000EF74F75|nr:RNA pyrophosphohydrolase [Helicobacter burdigaliensis]
MRKEAKTYRPNVAAVILSSKYPLNCELFIASRSDIKNAWQFPQGGIDKSETPKEALFRELKEEIGTDNVDIIAEYPEWISYDFPPSVVKKMYPYDGQIQKYFLVRLKENSKINIKTEEPEFDAYKFVEADKVFEYITYFKRPVYRQVLEYFKKKGYL